MSKLPSFEVYGNYVNGNYGAHALMFTDGMGCEYWFSYQTLVAFRGPDGRRVVRQNDWSTTTGKHLNVIDGGAKKTRVSSAEFERLFFAAFGRSVQAA